VIQYVFKNNVQILKFSSFKNEEKTLGLEDFIWLKTKEKFICLLTQDYKNEHSKNIGVYIVDELGNIEKKIYGFKNKEYYFGMMPSPKDNKLVLFTWSDSLYNTNPEIPYGKTKMYIIDLNSGNIEFNYNNFGTISDNIHESCWSQNEEEFVYIKPPSCFNRNPNKLINKNNFETDDGVFIYDITNKSSKKIASYAKVAIWSPVSDSIAYLAQDGIYIYDVKNHLKKKIKNKPKRKSAYIGGIHFSPDGEYLFVERFSLFSPKGKLLRISDGKYIPFKSPIEFMCTYTWK